MNENASQSSQRLSKSYALLRVERAGNGCSLAPIGLPFLRAFENVRGDAALFQGFTELDAQKAAGGVARDTGIKPVGQAAHHRRVFVQQLGDDREVVLVDDRIDPPAEATELGFDGFADRLDVATAAHREALQIDEEQILLLVEGEALVERNRQHVVAQVHDAFSENTRVHVNRIARDARFEIHQRQDVALDIDTGGNFGEHKSIWTKRKDTALRNVQDALRPLVSVSAAERHMFDSFDELA